jgi:F420-0:gamma-glutamyl ligase
MNIKPFKIEILRPPQDDLLSKIKNSKITLQEGDVIALSSKVVAIHQGRCVARDGTDKDALIKAEADLYLDRSETPGGFVMHTIINNTFIPNSGIDPFANYYVLWPTKPQETAQELLEWFKKEYGIKTLYLVLTDSHSVFLRRGVVGMAIAWAGFDPLYDNRLTPDLLGVAGGGSQTNLPDSIAAAAVLVMGEANEQTPLVRLRDVPYIGADYVAHKQTATSFEVSKEEDIFAPFLNVEWKKGGTTSS